MWSGLSRRFHARAWGTSTNMGQTRVPQTQCFGSVGKKDFILHLKIAKWDLNICYLKIPCTTFVPRALILLAVRNETFYYPLKHDISSHRTVLYKLTSRTHGYAALTFPWWIAIYILSDFFFFFFSVKKRRKKKRAEVIRTRSDYLLT